jgi:putative redox protein
MSLTATSRSISGTLRQEIVIDGKHRLITDEPVEVGGDGSAPAPHELLPAALASRVSTTLVMYARRKGWELSEVRLDASYDHRATPRRVDLTIGLGADLSAEQLELWRRSLPRAQCAARSKRSSSSMSRSSRPSLTSQCPRNPPAFPGSAERRFRPSASITAQVNRQQSAAHRSQGLR